MEILLAGDLAFIASDSPIRRISLNGNLTGFDLNGESLGGLLFAEDLDGDGDTDDPTALWVDGRVRSLRVAGSVGGDVLVASDVGRLTTAGDLLGDVYVTGSLRRAAIGGDLGEAGDLFDVAGDLYRLSVGSRREPGAVWADVSVGGDVRRFSAGPIYGTVAVTGDLGSLTTTSELLTGTGQTDFIFDNPDPDPDGELIVAGRIGGVRWV